MNGVGPDLNDIQGDIVPGFRNDYRDLLFLRFPDRESARRWLGQLYNDVSSAKDVATFTQLRGVVRHPPKLGPLAGGAVPPVRPDRDVTRTVRTTWVNVALTAEGLKILVTAPQFAGMSFPPNFTNGMVRAKLDYPAEVAAWQVRDRAGENGESEALVAHAVLILGADTAKDLDEARSRERLRLESLGLTLIVPPYRGKTLGGGREHFGFMDGIAHPDPEIPRLLAGWRKSDTVIAPGEFIVGQLDETDSRTFVGPAWARNGSYLAFRRLRQFVGRFRASARSARAELASSMTGVDQQFFANGVDENFMEAKMVGRWPSGAKLLAPAAGASPEQLDRYANRKPPTSRLTITDPDFDGDRGGDGCPLFSHVRRARPPDSSGHEPRRHRILRRAITYGNPLRDGARDTGDRGLLFLAYQSRLENGFEHIQRVWFNSGQTPEAPGGASFHGWDPIVGIIADGDPAESHLLHYHVRGTPPPSFGTKRFEVQRLVEVTAGGYFFAPSISALWYLSTM